MSEFLDFEPPPEPPEDAHLVRCHYCNGKGRLTRDRGRHQVVRACRECSSSGRLLPEPIFFDLSHLLLPEDDEA